MLRQVKGTAFCQLNNCSLGCDIRCHFLERPEASYRCNVEDGIWPVVVLIMVLSSIYRLLSLLAHSQGGMFDAKSVALDVDA